MGTVIIDACVVDQTVAIRAASMDVLITLCSIMRNFGFMSKPAVEKMLVLVLLLTHAKMAGCARIMGTTNSNALVRKGSQENFARPAPTVFAKCSMDWPLQKFGKLMDVAE